MLLPISNDNSGIIIHGLKNKNNTTLKIFNITGQTLISKTINDISTEINISQLPEGIYMLKIINSSGEEITKKFIKE